MVATYITSLGTVMREDRPRCAIVVEPDPLLADTVADVLRRRGYTVDTAATHVGGAEKAREHERVDTAVAAVPAPGEDLDGAYLDEARKVNPNLCMVVMLSDPDASVAGAPAAAVQLLKPFSVSDLEWAVSVAEARGY